MSRLKGIISNLGDSNISKETGYWKIYIDYSKVYVDYAYFYNIVRASSQDEEMIFKLIKITRNNPFLLDMENDWLDPFKSDVSNDTVDTLVNWAKANSGNSDPASIIKEIETGGCARHS